MRPTLCKFVKAVFVLSILSFLVTSLNFMVAKRYDLKIFDAQFGVTHKYDYGDESHKDHLHWEQDEAERMSIMNQLYRRRDASSGNGSGPEFYGNLTLSEIKNMIWQRNRNQVIHNLDLFDLPVDESAIVVVVQVHNRPEYLRHLVASLEKARDIERTLVIFSHDFYSEELDTIITSIDFCPVRILSILGMFYIL